MRTGGIQGSQGPSVERQTEMANGGGGVGDWGRSTAELESQHSGIRLGIKIRVAQSDWTHVHTR